MILSILWGSFFVGERTVDGKVCIGDTSLSTFQNMQNQWAIEIILHVDVKPV